MRSVFAVGLLVLLFAAPSLGQSALTLTLAEAIDRAQTQSPSAEIARLEYQRDRWAFRAFRSTLRPSISLFANGPNLRRSIEDLDQDDGSIRYVSRSSALTFGNLSVSQVLPWTGGTISLRSGLSRIDQFGDFDFLQWQSSPLVVEYEQPLFAFNEYNWDRKTEPMQYEAAQRRFAEQGEQIAIDITERFFDVYLAEMIVQNAEFNLSVNDTVNTLAQGRFEIGTIAENELLQTELQVLNAQTNLANARIIYQQALQDLRTDLGLPIDTELEIIPPSEIIPMTVSPEVAMEMASRNRSDFLDQELFTLQAERNVAQVRSQNRFNANLTASYGLNQTAPTLDGAYTNPLDQQRVTLSLQVPLYQSGAGRAAVNSALLDLEQTEQTIALQREREERQVYFEALNFDQVVRQVESAAKADTIATRRFDVAKNRYLIGRIDITDLFNAQQAKDAAQQGYIQALRRYWISFYSLRRLTLFDFVRNEPIAIPTR